MQILELIWQLALIEFAVVVLVAAVIFTFILWLCWRISWRR
jgi:hypothetical protein